MLTLHRYRSNDNCTIGELFFTPYEYSLPCYICDILELPAVKRIPAGIYNLTKVHSPKLGYDVLLLSNVPNHSAIEIHRGNTVADTEGCLLTGYENNDSLVLSTIAHNHLMELFNSSIFNQIQIINSDGNN
jgi:hypothetical protein